jgi:hypothetical protein
MLQIASYAGPEAPASRVREAEAVAAGVRLVRTEDPTVPATASKPSGTTAGSQGLAEVARAGAGRTSVVLEAGADCGYLRPADSQPVVPGHDRLGGARPAVPASPRSGGRARLGDPGTAPSSAITIRFGPDVRTVTARTADGRTFPAVLGVDGWGLAVGPGRIVVVAASDSAGRLVEAFVP